MSVSILSKNVFCKSHLINNETYLFKRVPKIWLLKLRHFNYFYYICNQNFYFNIYTFCYKNMLLVSITALWDTFSYKKLQEGIRNQSKSWK